MGLGRSAFGTGGALGIAWVCVWIEGGSGPMGEGTPNAFAASAPLVEMLEPAPVIDGNSGTSPNAGKSPSGEPGPKPPLGKLGMLPLATLPLGVL
jgi:hypothetical protein